VIDWDAFAAHFPWEYNGILSLEILAKDHNSDPKIVLAEAYAALKEIESRIETQHRSAEAP